VRITLSKHSAKFLNKLSSGKESNQITMKTKQLAANGHLNDSRKLKGVLSDFHRVDIGEFRIIYRIENDSLFILAIGKRNDSEVYKTAERIVKT
jgi:mRNA interferase RelE/StbE